MLFLMQWPYLHAIQGNNLGKHIHHRDFPSPPAPSDLQNTPNKVNNRPPLNETTAQRESDKNYAKDFNNRVGRDDPLKRPQDKTNSGE